MKRRLFILLLIAGLFAACNKAGEFIPEPEEFDQQELATRSIQPTSDPYKLEVMQSALNQIIGETPGASSITLKPTDYYVRFMPRDTIQMDVLQACNIELFDHPLDIEPANYAIETDDENDEFEWLYSVVPTDFVFPEAVEHEILYSVFIQRESKASSEQQLPMELYNTIRTKAMQLTNNLPATRTTEVEEPWRPAARIMYRIVQDNGNPVDLPLPKAKVRVWQKTNIIGFMTTNSEGETFPMSDVTGAVNYDLAWQCCCWNIHQVNTRKMYTTLLATDSKAPIEILFSEGRDAALAGVHRVLAAYFHEYHPLAATLAKPERINVAFINQYNPDMSGEFSPARKNRIHVYGKYNTGAYRSVFSCASTTAHELGHASHYELKPANYLAHVGTDAHCESWANGVRYVYMKSIFPEYEYKGQTNTYTKLVECLMNQGITLETIQTAFNRGAHWYGWRDQIKKLTDVPDEWINMIFNHPNDLCFDIKNLIKTPYFYVYRNQPVFLSVEDNNNLPPTLKVSSWEVVDGEGEIIQTDNKIGTFLFNTIGEKTIRATVEFYDGVVINYDKTVSVRPTDILNVPEKTEQLHPFNDVHFSLNTGDYFSDVREIIWEVPNGILKKANETNTSRVYTFAKEHPKTKVKVTLRYAHKTGMFFNLSYEKEITISRLPDLNSFEILKAPPYEENGEYSIRYKIPGERAEIKDMFLVHNTSYVSVRNFECNKELEKPTFIIPKMLNLTIDYTLEIFYTIRGFPNDVRHATVVVSNLR